MKSTPCKVEHQLLKTIGARVFEQSVCWKIEYLWTKSAFNKSNILHLLVAHLHIWVELSILELTGEGAVAEWKPHRLLVQLLLKTSYVTHN